MGVFDNKNFNSEVFGKYLETVPRVKQNALLKSGVLRNRGELKSMLTEQTGGNFITVPMTGRIGGTALNYDGSTNITSTGLETYLQSMIVVGRAKAWKEKDFTFDISSKDFMPEIAAQVADYWDDVDQTTLLSILSGIFGVSAFASSNSLDITGNMTAVTLNNAVQKAAGANKNIFTMAIMHSVVATNLENLQILEYAKYTDANGVQKDVAMGTWNGRTVLIDDDVPVSSDTTPKYTTYLLGAGAFDYVDCGAKVPNETYRDPLTNGGEEQLITRQRKIFAPKGFSFNQPSTAIVSPTDAQLATAARWALVKDTSGNTYPTNAIPIARITSEG